MTQRHPVGQPRLPVRWIREAAARVLQTPCFLARFADLRGTKIVVSLKTPCLQGKLPRRPVRSVLHRQLVSPFGLRLDREMPATWSLAARITLSTATSRAFPTATAH